MVVETNHEEEERKNMKTEYVWTGAHGSCYREKAEIACPWAYKIIEVDGGYMAFESWDSYQTWKNQK